MGLNLEMRAADRRIGQHQIANQTAADRGALALDRQLFAEVGALGHEQTADAQAPTACSLGEDRGHGARHCASARRALIACA